MNITITKNRSISKKRKRNAATFRAGCDGSRTGTPASQPDQTWLAGWGGCWGCPPLRHLPESPAGCPHTCSFLGPLTPALRLTLVLPLSPRETPAPSPAPVSVGPSQPLSLKAGDVVLGASCQHPLEAVAERVLVRSEPQFPFSARETSAAQVCVRGQSVSHVPAAQTSTLSSQNNSPGPGPVNGSLWSCCLRGALSAAWYSLCPTWEERSPGRILAGPAPCCPRGPPAVPSRPHPSPHLCRHPCQSLASEPSVTNRETEAWIDQRLWMSIKERHAVFRTQAHGSHQICQEICDPHPLSLNYSPSKAGTKLEGPP